MDLRQFDLIVFALGLAFGAGSYAVALRATRKQVNGLGARVNRIALAVVHICPTEKYEEVVRIILGGESKGQQ
jgi:hypothetical protein